MTLRPYQEDIRDKALKILHERKILYLSMEVRTGKTITSMAIAETYKAKSVLFVTKKKAISSIKSDYEKARFGFKLQVTNFESVHKSTGDYDFIIVDEAHSIGAYPTPSKRTIHLKKIVGKKPLILLSGTPTPESHSQIYHQLMISSHSPFKEPNFYKWTKTYVIVKRQMINGYWVNNYDDAKVADVMSVIKPYMISFSQEEAGFEALVEEYVHKLPVTDRLMEIYKTIKYDRVLRFGEGQTISAATPATLLQKLHQISSGTILTDEGERVLLDPFKAQYIKDRFEGQHIAIFYKFVAEREMLKAYFKNIVDTPEEFNSDQRSIFIGQYQSAREGINLSSADALVMMSIDFSAVSYFQAKARLQTKDRTTPARIHWIFSDGLLDEYVHQAVSNKQDFTLRYYGKHATKSR